MFITEHFFNQIIKFIKNNTGIDMPDTNYQHIKRFLSSRLSSLNMKPEIYLAHIKENKDEYDRFIDAVTINETYFFREQKHFKLIDSIIFQNYANTKQNLSFWSAACSTGEEAVSIAALAETFWGDSSAYTVFASDLNPIALEVFKKGKFNSNSFRKDGSCFHHLLKPFIRYQGALHFLKNSLKQKIKIFQINLLHDDLRRLPDNINIVFLRNTLIYISIEKRQKILDKIVRKMSIGGFLFLSSSETSLVSHQLLLLKEHQGVYYFQKKNIYEKKQGSQSNEKLFNSIREEKLSKKSENSFCTDKEKAKDLVNIDEITFYANQKLNNRLFVVKGNINYSIAIQLIEIVFLINSNQFSKAKELLKLVTRITVADEISLYLSGYIDMAEQNEEKAIMKFSRSLKCNISFWPSRFYMGMLFQKISPRKALIEFELCQRSIISYLENGSSNYQFLLEGFNAKYFLEICKKMNS